MGGMAPRRKATPRWWVWALVPVAAVAGALSANADAAVRTAEYGYGAVSTYGLDVRVWGLRLHKERVHGTPATLHAQALVRERQWRFRLAAASALASGFMAAVAVTVYWHFPRRQGRTGLPPESDGPG